MSYFFDGRLITTPAVVSRVDDSAMDNPNGDVGNVAAFLGRSADGKPNSVLRFGNAGEARATLISGELLECVLAAFDPSNETPAPSEVVAIRVNPALQATLVLQSAATVPVINLASQPYGVRANRIAVKVEAGTVRGVKLTTKLADVTYSADNVARDAFSIRYTGSEATAVIQTSNTSIIVSAPSGTPVATLDLNDFKTIQEVADRLNGIPNIAVTVLDGSGQQPALNGLDTVTAQDIKAAAFTVRADLQAAVDWLNGQGEGFVTATRAANAGAIPAPIPFTYLSGGTDGVVTNTNWTVAFETLQTADVQWCGVASSAPDIHAMLSAHVSYMSSTGRSERRAVAGAPTATTDTAAIALAKAINSDRVSLTHLGVYDYDAAGTLILQPPYIAAAKVIGAFAGVTPGTPLTGRSLKIQGLERRLRNPTDTDALIRGGVLCIEDTREGYKVVKSISTWLNDSKYNRVEQSTGAAVDFTARTLRGSVESLKGRKGSPITLGQARANIETALSGLARPEPVGLAVLVGDEASPAWRNLVVRLSGDVIEIAVEVQPAIGINYIAITIYARPYSGVAA
jgi:hypothetical protein